MDEFTPRGIWEKNLSKLWDAQIEKKNKDITMVIAGQPGTGKSALSIMTGLWAADNLSGCTFGMDHLSFGHEQWIEKEQEELPQRAYSQYDEGRDTFNLRRAMHNENKDGLDHLNQHRYKNLMRAINFQNFYELEPELWNTAAEVVVRCVKQGWAWVYSQKSTSHIERNTERRSVEWGKPDFRIAWPDPAETIPEIWSEYEPLREKRMEEKRNRRKSEQQRTVTCQQCEHSWAPRVDVPRQCPECNTRNWNPRVAG